MSNTCRLCHKFDEHLVRYGIRHYAHADCGLQKWGAQFFNKLSQYECEQFPAMVASRHKLLPALEARLASLRA